MLGVKWNDQYYIDKVLPFSLQSSPAILNLLANAVCWILRENYGLKSLEFYLDDFIGVGPAPISNPQTSTAAIQKATLIEVFNNLGIPIATFEDRNVDRPLG